MRTRRGNVLLSGSIVLAVSLGAGYLLTAVLVPAPIDEAAARERQLAAELGAPAAVDSEIERTISELADLTPPELELGDRDGVGGGGGGGDAPGDGQLPTDPEWETFERTDLYLPLLLSTGSQLVQAHELYRNQQLNPVDVYIHPRHREVIAACIEQYKAVDEKLEQAEADATAHEVSIAIERGVGKRIEGRVVPHKHLPVEFQAGIERQFAAKGLSAEVPLTHTMFPKMDGKRYITRYFGDHGIAVPVRALPKTRAVREARAFVATELGGAIISYFTGLGLLSDEAAVATGEDIVESLSAVAQAR